MPDPTPFAALARLGSTQVGTKSSLLALSRSIEARASGVSGEVHLWVCLQSAEFFVGRTREIYEQLAADGATVDIYGQGLPARLGPHPNLRGHDLSPYAPLAGEWNVLLTTPTESLAMTASELPPRPPGGDPADDGQRRFAWLITSSPPDIRFAAASLSSEPFVAAQRYA